MGKMPVGAEERDLDVLVVGEQARDAPVALHERPRQRRRNHRRDVAVGEHVAQRLGGLFHLDPQVRGRLERDVLAALDQPSNAPVRNAVMLLQNAAHPDVGCRLEIRTADRLADQVLGRRDACTGVDEDEAVAEAAMQEDRDRRQCRALVACHEVGADVLLADVEFVLASHAPVALARPHVGEKDQIEPVGLDGAFDQRLDDVVVAAGDGESQLCHCGFLSRDARSFSSSASAESAPRPGGRFR